MARRGRGGRPVIILTACKRLFSLGCVPHTGENDGDEWAGNSDRDVFEDVKDKLKSGVLYYAYALPENNLTTITGNGILSFMFPITPR